MDIVFLWQILLKFSDVVVKTIIKLQPTWWQSHRVFIARDEQRWFAIPCFCMATLNFLDVLPSKYHRRQTLPSEWANLGYPGQDSKVGTQKIESRNLHFLLLKKKIPYKMFQYFLYVPFFFQRSKYSTWTWQTFSVYSWLDLEIIPRAAATFTLVLSSITRGKALNY